MDSALHYTSVSHAHSLVGNINKMRLAADLCDVTVVVGNFRIMAHRVVLSACTPFFYQMFCTSPKIPSEYRLDNVDETAALKIIEFCYTSTISVTPELAWPLLAAASQVELPEICGLCCDLLASDLSLGSCLAMHLSAARLGESAAAQLLKASAQFLENNMAELCKSQQLYDLNELELVELFKSLSPASARACFKLATSWLGRIDGFNQVSVVDKLKHSCPYLADELSDFLAERSHCPDEQCSTDDLLSKDTKGRELSSPGGYRASFPLDRGASPHCWNDSGYSEPVRRGEETGKEEDFSVHMCVRCGDTFDSDAELLAHQRRQCEEEEEGSQVPEPKRMENVDDPSQAENVPVSENILEGQKLLGCEDLSSSSSYSQAQSIPQARNDNSKSKESGNIEDHNSVKDPQKLGSEINHFGEGLSEDNANTSDKQLLNKTGAEATGGSNGWDTLDANDSNNNDINAKVSADADSSDEIDVINDDDDEATSISFFNKPEKGNATDFPRREPYIYRNSVGIKARDIQDSEQNCGLKCQFCGLTVLDGEEELAIHWKEIHGVSQDSSQEHKNGKEGPVLDDEQSTGDTLNRSYLKRGFSGNDLQSNPGETLKAPSKKPKIERASEEKEGLAPQVKNDVIGNNELTTSAEAKLAKSEDLRAKMREGGDMSGLLQYMQQYNELAKWYMEQGLVFCHMCMVYHDKNTKCPKMNPRLNDTQGSPESKLKHDPVFNVKRENIGKESNGCNGTDAGDQGESSHTTHDHVDVGEEEGPLDMSKTSLDFSSPLKYSSAYSPSSQHLEALTGAARGGEEKNSHFSKDLQYLSQQQLELAHYYDSYSRIMAAVATASTSSSASAGDAGNRSLEQFGLQGSYGMNRSTGLGPVAGDYGHPGLYMPTPDAGSKAPGALVSEVAGSHKYLAAHKSASDRMVYGTSTTASSPSSVTSKHFGSSSDMHVYPAHSHRKQRSSHVSSNQSFQEVLASTELALNRNSTSFSTLPLSAETPLSEGVHSAGQASGSRKTQSRKKQGSRQGFPCTVCNRVFSYQTALFTHMKVHSPSARIYQCQLCQRTFDRAPDLKVHVCPNGVEKPYVCPSCGQTFAKNIHLKRHLATHSGLKPYPCWVCGKRFSRSDHLKRHTQSIHAGSRPHACHLCGKEFVRKYELNKHMLVHSSYASGEQVENLMASVTNSPANELPDGTPHLDSPQHLGEAATGSPEKVSMQLPVTAAAVPT